MKIKNIDRERISKYVEKFPLPLIFKTKRLGELKRYRSPCATQNELQLQTQKVLLKMDVFVLAKAQICLQHQMQ